MTPVGVIVPIIYLMYWELSCPQTKESGQPALLDLLWGQLLRNKSVYICNNSWGHNNLEHSRIYCGDKYLYRSYWTHLQLIPGTWYFWIHCGLLWGQLLGKEPSDTLINSGDMILVNSQIYYGDMPVEINSEYIILLNTVNILWGQLLSNTLMFAMGTVTPTWVIEHTCN